MDVTELKRQAAEMAVTFVESGMVVGLGVGSTAVFAVRRIGQLLAEGVLTDIVGVPCAERVAAEARELGIPLTTLEEHPVVDLTIDGADEVDPEFNVIKGGGGALLREKIVAQASRREIIVVDEGKLSPHLGTTWALPIEVVSFGWGSQAAFLRELGGDPVLRRTADGTPFVTDHGNYILDTDFGPMSGPGRSLQTLNNALNGRIGIVEHGLFLGLTTDLIVASPQGVRHQAK
jgi:ribose 5-phosphate isomerase A